MEVRIGRAVRRVGNGSTSTQRRPVQVASRRPSSQAIVPRTCQAVNPTPRAQRKSQGQERGCWSWGRSKAARTAQAGDRQDSPQSSVRMRRAYPWGLDMARRGCYAWPMAEQQPKPRKSRLRVVVVLLAVAMVALGVYAYRRWRRG